MRRELETGDRSEEYWEGMDKDRGREGNWRRRGMRR
jgi:hypothetical protein